MLAAPVVTGRFSDPMPAAQIRRRHAVRAQLQNRQVRRLGKSRSVGSACLRFILLFVDDQRRRRLVFKPFDFREDYRQARYNGFIEGWFYSLKPELTGVEGDAGGGCFQDNEVRRVALDVGLARVTKAKRG